MPLIRFPSLDALTAVLADGTVPPATARQSVDAAVDSETQVWVRTAAPLSKTVVTGLTRKGGRIGEDSAAPPLESAVCWAAVLPLQPDSLDPPSAPVIFAVPDDTGVARLVSELDRLRSGRVSIRWCDPGQGALVRTDRAPAHSLLRAGDPGSQEIVAFVERSPRIWVEFGYRHPLGSKALALEKDTFLIRSPREWTIVPPGNFETGPGLLPLAAQHDRVAEAHTTPPLAVDIRLVPAASTEAAELWVLRDHAGPQLRALAEQSDERLIGQLDLAAGRVRGRRVVVLRARPSRNSPPVLVLDALACRPYQRLPNLFVPCGMRVQPALRRDALRGLFGESTAVVRWLEPTGRGGFSVETIPTGAFQPLSSYVEYSRPGTRALLVPDASGPLFTPTPFTVREMRVRRERPMSPISASPAPAPTQTEDDPPAPKAHWLQWLTRWFRQPTESTSDEPGPSIPERGPEAPRPAPVRDDRRTELERRVIDGPPDSPGDLWAALAASYESAGRWGDVAIALLNALWERGTPTSDLARRWLRAESCLRDTTVDATTLGLWLDGPPSPGSARAVAAMVVGSVAGAIDPNVVAPALRTIQLHLESQEAAIPVRALWLARLALFRLSGGDTVGLARARDRLLERLYHRGLSLDLDVPLFLRFHGQDSGGRARAVRDWLARCRETIHRWIATRPERPGTGPARLTPDLTTQDPLLLPFGFGTAVQPTRALADLILAWGMARLGDRATSREWSGYARAILAPGDEVHNVLLEAYEFRAREALDGRGPTFPLPRPLLDRIAALRRSQDTDSAGREQMPYYKVEKLRAASRIIDPSEPFDAFRVAVIARFGDDLDRALADLRGVADREELVRRYRDLLSRPGQAAGQDVRALSAALGAAPQLGEAFAVEVLDRLLAAVEGWSFAGTPDVVEPQVVAVERGLVAAAHFDRPDAVTRLLGCVDRLTGGRTAAGERSATDPLLALVRQGVRGLRRLGLREEMDRLVTRLERRLLPTPNLGELRRRRPAVWPATVQRLLALAAGWFTVGREEQARGVLDDARQLLFRNELPPHAQTDLAVAYVDTLAHAPPEMALERVDDLFHGLAGVTDSFATKTHYGLAQLRLIEAAVMAVVNDDFALGPAARRWLDDDEFRVRRRINADVRELVGAR